MSRLDVVFEELKREKRAALVSFFTAGFPNIRTSARLLCSLSSAGADIVEMGIPFSDASADGEIIRSASRDALKQGMGMRDIFTLAKKFRQENPHTPLVLMGYYNPIFHYGTERFIKESIRVGVDGVIVVDLPPEEENEVTCFLKDKELALIRLITPTTDKKRLDKIVSHARGFLYYVSITGITGTHSPELQQVKRHLTELNPDLPVAIGFGIKEPEQARAFGNLAQGVVIGSVLLRTIKDTIPANDDALEAALRRSVGYYAAALRR